MSKVALLLSGRLGEYEDCISNITSNIIEPLNADLYMYVSQGGKKDGIKEDMEPLKKYSPIKLEIEGDEPPTAVGFPPSPYHMHRKIQACFNLVDKQYDWIIKFRPDCKLSEPLDLSKLNPEEYNIPIGGDWLGGIGDIFCASNHSNMKYYCNLLEYVKDYSSRHPESMLKEHLHSVDINRFEVDILLRNRKYNL